MGMFDFLDPNTPGNMGASANRYGGITGASGGGGGMSGMSPYIALALQALGGGLQGAGAAQASGARGFGAGIGPGFAGAQVMQQRQQEYLAQNRYLKAHTDEMQARAQETQRQAEADARHQSQMQQFLATLTPQEQQMAALAPKEVIDAHLKQMFPDPVNPTSDMINYQYGKDHPDFAAKQESLKRAGATNVNVGGPNVFMPKPLQAGPEQMAKDGASAYSQAQATLPLFDVALDAAKRFPQSGSGGDWSLAWERGKNYMGLPNNAAAGETLQGIQTRLGTLQRVPGSGATSDMEMKLYMQAVPSLLNSQQGNIVLATIGKRLAKRRMANYEGWAKHYMATGTPFDYQPDDSPVLTKQETDMLMGAGNEPGPAASGGDPLGIR